MPSFAFLFELKSEENAAESSVLNFPEDSPYAPEKGSVIVPTRRAHALVNYLLSLKFDYNLPEAIIRKKMKQNNNNSDPHAELNDDAIQEIHDGLLKEKELPKEGFSFYRYFLSLFLQAFAFGVGFI